jgi:hypothetical protein
MHKECHTREFQDHNIYDSLSFSPFGISSEHPDDEAFSPRRDNFGLVMEEPEESKLSYLGDKLAQPLAMRYSEISDRDDIESPLLDLCESNHMHISSSDQLSNRKRTMAESLAMNISFQGESFIHSSRHNSLPRPQESSNIDETLKIYFSVREKTPYELIDEMKDDWPLLDFRKASLRIYRAFREGCKLIVSSSLFESFIIMIIIANCVVLALEDPTEEYSNDHPLAILEQIFLYIYTAEAFLKITSQGFIRGKNAYIRDRWNLMDFTIVIISWITEFIEEGVNLSAFRIVRILRPLRSISSIQGLRVIFLALLNSLTMLLNSVALLMFFFFVFAIAGLQLWMGVLKYRCMDIDVGDIHEDSICGNLECYDMYECARGLDNPNHGVTNFDNILYSFLTTFQCVTLEGWTLIMIMVQKAYSGYVVLYFIPLVFIGAFFLVNITLAVLKSSFSRMMEKATRENEIDLDEESVNGSFIARHIDRNVFPQVDQERFDPEYYKIRSPKLGPTKTKSSVEELLETSHDHLGLQAAKKISVKESSIEARDQTSEKNQSTVYERRSRPIIHTIKSIVHEIEPEIRIRDASDNEAHPFSVARYSTDRRIYDNQQEDNFSLESQISERNISDSQPENRDSQQSPLNSESYLRRSLKLMTSRKPTVKRVESAPEPNTAFQEITPLTRSIQRSHSSFTRRNTVRESDASSWLYVSPMIQRVKTLKIRKTVMEKLKNVKEIETVKIEISYKFEQSYSSFYDIKPFVEKVPEYASRYLFQYEDIEILKDSEDYTALQDNKVRSQFSSFLHLAKKLSLEDAFKSQVNFTFESISKIRNDDQLYKLIKGTWSGADVNPSYPENSNLIQRLNQNCFDIRAKGLLGKLDYCRQPLYRLSISKAFGIFMTACVGLNTLVLSMYHYGISDEMNNTLNQINLSFTALFAAEMAIKLIGLGIRRYFKDAMNYLDGLVVVLSLIELIFLSGERSAFSAFRAIRVFRIFRVMRVARLFRYFKSMTSIMLVISNSISKFIYLAILLLIFSIIFTLVGMQLFGGKFDFPDGTPRWNFDSFQIAFITVFQILTLENWNLILYDAMRSDLGPASCIYFIVWIFLGNYVMLNLFLAILLDSFLQSSNAPVYLDDETTSSRSRVRISGFTKFGSKKRKEKLQKIMDELGDSFDEDSSSIVLSPQTEVPAKPLFHEIECSHSYHLFSKTNRFRILCYEISTSQKFETLILILIILSTIKLVIDTYIINEPDDSNLVVASEYLDTAFTIAFALEMIIRSVSMGFVMDKGSYLRDGWNKLDFFIVVFSVIEESISEFDMPVIRVLRLLRTLRPLRFINKNISMKIVIKAMIESLAALLNVGVVLVLVWLMFAILGVSLFGGKFYSCSNPNLTTRDECEKYGNDWETYDPNFDNVPEAYMALFIVSSGENWPDIMRHAMDVTEEDHAPVKDNTIYAAYYFIIFVFIGSYFFLNLFIGVIFEHFNEAKNQEDNYLISSEFLNKSQSNWIDLQKLIVTSKPQVDVVEVPENPLRRFFYMLCRNFWFEMFILFCIVCNVLQMALAYDEASDEYNQILENINLGFTLVFIIEALTKIIGLSPATYFRSSWNKFDFVVVMTSIVDLIMTFFLGSSVTFLRVGPQLARIMRVLRVSRLIRILKSLNDIQDLLNILALALPATMNIFSLLLLVFFIYAILGVYLFHQVTSGDAISNYTNFKNFHMAMIALFRISTGEEWNSIMYDCEESNGYIVSAVYFGSFVTITTFIMLNMFIMIIVQEYENYESDAENIIKVFQRYSKVFKKKWAKYSAGSKGLRVYYTALIDLMYSLGERNGGAPADMDRHKVIQRLSVLRLNFDDEGYIYYNDFLFAILKWKYGKGLTKGAKDNPIKKFLHQEETKTLRKLKSIRDKARASLSDYQASVLHLFSGKNSLLITMMYARTVFRSWKNYVKRKRGVFSPSHSSPSILSDAEFPGENTPFSITHHSPSKNVSSEIEIETKSTKVEYRLRMPTVTRSTTLISKNSKSLHQDGELD